jgi:hypothetical protein
MVVGLITTNAISATNVVSSNLALEFETTRFDCSFIFVITVNTTIATPKGNKTILKL